VKYVSILLLVILAISLVPIAKADNQIQIGVEIPNSPYALYVTFTTSIGAPDGGVYISGTVYNDTVNRPDVLLAKLDQNGNLAWAKDIYAGLNIDRPFITLAQDGSIYIAGDGYNFTAGYEQLFIAKLDQNGNPIWVKTLDTGSDSWMSDFTVASDGSIYATGYRENTTTNEYDIFILKLDQNGNLVWFKDISSNFDQYDNGGIAIAPDGNIIIAGNINNDTSGYTDPFVAKLDQGGNLIWFKEIYVGSDSYAGDVAVYSDGSIYIAGNSYTPLHNNIFVAKIDQNGNLIWAERLDTGSDSFAYGDTVAPDGNVYITGQIYNSTTNSWYVFAAKLDQNGNLIWVKDIYGGLYNYESITTYECKLFVTTEASVIWGYINDIDTSAINVANVTTTTHPPNLPIYDVNITVRGINPVVSNTYVPTSDLSAPVYGTGLFNVCSAPSNEGTGSSSRNLGGIAEPMTLEAFVGLLSLVVSATVVFDVIKRK